MQFSIVNFNELKKHSDFRIDAECFKSKYLELEKRLNIINTISISDISKSVINFGAYSLCNYIEFIEDGIPFLVTEDIKDNIINITKLHYISESVHNILHKSHCKKGQILLSMAGAYLGQAAVFDFDFECSSNQAIAKITLKENTFDPYFVSTFLNCKYGQYQIKRYQTGTGQPNLNLGLIKTIKIPVLSINFQKIISSVVIEGTYFYKKSNMVYHNVEKIILSELNLLNWKPKHYLSFIKNFSDTYQSDRFDAEYFHPKYDEIINSIKIYKFGWKFLGNLVNIKKSIEPGSNAYLDKGIPFIRVSDISKFEISLDNPKYISESLYEELKEHQPQKGEILLSKDATPGIAFYLFEDPQKMITSGGILRLTVKSDKIFPEYLTLVLNSLLVQQQMLRDAGGSIINHWRLEQIKNVIIPILPFEKQKDISEKFYKSFIEREKSKQLINIAKKAIEIAIEKNETFSQEFIFKELKKFNIKIEGL